MKRQLPLLDISLFYSNQALFVEKLRSACHNVGFFLLKHDLPSGLVEEQLEVSKAFFALPSSEKMRVSYDHSPSFRGYMQLGVENTAGQVDFREQLEYAVEYDPPPDCRTSWPPYTRLKGTNPWPDATMERVCKEYAKHVCRIADCIRTSLCLALQLDENALSQHFDKPDEPPHWVMKLISYPPAKDAAGGQGVGPHTDTNFLTLVLQDQVGGLQAFTDGEWIDVPSLGSNVLVCNLGEQTQVWSRGYFLATPHRVLATPAQRISVPLFYNPALSAQIQPIDADAVIPESLLWERSIEKKHWHRDNNAMLASVGENTFKSLARSHPKVFAKHHGDLTLLPDGRAVSKSS
jgi:isopenicillin N synthase-like dioxygenase